jgi:hypothetical protein
MISGGLSTWKELVRDDTSLILSGLTVMVETEKYSPDVSEAMLYS